MSLAVATRLPGSPPPYRYGVTGIASTSKSLCVARRDQHDNPCKVDGWRNGTLLLHKESICTRGTYALVQSGPHSGFREQTTASRKV